MDETPASFDVFAVSPHGFEVHFQIDGDKVYQEASKLLATMQKEGFCPKVSSGNHRGNGLAKEENKVCPIHDTALKRHENGQGA